MLSASALIIPAITNTSSNNSLLYVYIVKLENITLQRLMIIIVAYDLPTNDSQSKVRPTM